VNEADPADLRPLVELIQDPYLRGITQESIAKEQLRRGKAEKSVETARSIEDGRAKSAALCSLARELLGKNDELARPLLDQGQTSGGSISEAWGRGRALSVTARLWARAGNREAALKLAPEVEAARKELTVDHERTRVLNEVAIAYASGGDLAKALEILGAGAGDWSFGMVAAGLVEAGDFVSALKVAGLCKNALYRAEVLYEQSKQEPRSEEARKLRIESATLMETVDAKFRDLNDVRNGTSEQNLLHHLMEAFAEAGDFETSSKIALRREKDMGPWFGGFALRSAAQAQAQAGRLEDALKWIGGIENPLPRSLALAGAAEGVLKRARR
jgi:hypothetical protein